MSGLVTLVDGEWQPLGWIDAESIWFSEEPDGREAFITTAQDISASFDFTLTALDEKLLMLYYGHEPERANLHSVLIEVQEPWLEPRHPRKARWLTGKRYRQACRAWRRLHRAWRRAEPKLHTVATYIPYARVTPDEHGFTITPTSPGIEGIYHS